MKDSVKNIFTNYFHGKDFRRRLATGGGSMYDVGCYGLQLIHQFSRSRVQLIAAEADYFGSSGSDRTSSAWIKFDNGITANLLVSFDMPPAVSLRIILEKGVISVPSFIDKSNRIHIDTTEDHEEITVPELNPILEQLCHFVNVIQGGKPIPIGDSLQRTSIIDLFFKKTEKKNEVERVFIQNQAS
jgi:predicted dehydrogenase